MEKVVITLKAGNQSHAVLCIPTIENVLKYAKNNGLPGDTISLSDGRLVKDDDTFHYFALKEAEFELKTTIWPVELEVHKIDTNKPTMQPREEFQSSRDVLEFQNEGEIEFVKVEPNEVMVPASKLRNNAICYEDSDSSNDETPSFKNGNDLKKRKNNWDEDDSSSNAPECSQNFSNILSFGNFPEDMGDDALNMSLGSAKLGKFKNFQIPLMNFPHAVRKLLKEKKPLGKHLNSVATVLVRELRHISIHLPMAVLRQITKQFSDMYPESFYVKDSSGTVNSSICFGLVAKMRSRNCYLNRPTYDSDNPPSGPPAKRNKNRNTFESTCVNWSPTVTNEDINRLTPLKQKMRACEGSSADFTHELKECFPLVRMDLNKNMSIRNEWPILFIPKYAFLHFEQLNEFDIRCISSTFTEKENDLYEHLKNGVRNHSIRQSVKRTPYSMLWHIFQYFNEDMELCCKIFNACTSLDDIQPPAETPWAAILQDKKSQNMTYIYLDKEIVAKVEDYELIQIFALLIAYYYNFNIRYPKSITQSMEFIVRFLGKYQSEVFRGFKHAINEKAKVLNLLISI